MEALDTGNKKNMEQTYIIDKGKDPDLIRLDSKKNHKGEIKCLLYEKISGLDVLISGSADRTIKLWEPKNLKSDPCFQTIIGSGGTIIDMKYVRKNEILITSSTDKTVRIWRMDKGRELLMYPWFVPLEVIKDFTSINPTAIDNNVWVNCLDMQEGDKFKLYAGDSEGSVVTFSIAKGHEYSSIFEPSGKHASIHRIGILQILLVPQENIVFTISFDQHLKAFDTAFSSDIFCLKNPNKVIYTSIFWDSQVLYIADQMGYIGVLNVYMEKPFFWKRMVKEPIKKIEITPITKHLVVMTEYVLQVYKIRKGEKSHDLSGHQGPILKIITLEPERLPMSKVHDDPKILTCSLDNTIRFWDAKDMSTISVMESPPDSELSCMTYLMNCGLVATGHEDGEVRVWNLEINSFVTLKCSDKNKHTNTISCIQGVIFKDSEFLLCGSFDGNVSIWEISKKSSGQSSMLNSSIFPQLRSVISNYVPNKSDILGNEIHSLYFDDKNANIIVGGNPVNINIWSMQTGDKVATLEGMHSDTITCMAMEENFLFSGSDDQTIVMWNMISFQHVGVLRGHKDSIQDLLLFDNGLLFSCSYDRKINIWRYHTEEIVDSLERNEEFRCLDCIRSYNKLLAGSNDKDILTFDIESLIESERYNYDISSVGGSDKFHEEDKELNSIHESDNFSEAGPQINISHHNYHPYEEEKVTEDGDNLNDTEFLNKQEIEDDDQLKTILEEQQRIMQKDEELRNKTKG